ncbi:MAG: YhcH/YjgK/YiaL family protein [Clostridia bacterium]|nr:YhcH/YjgK/YiaL family protein [Clostridia bacterium]
MIFDNLNYATKYSFLSENFKKAFDFLSTTDLSKLEVGKGEIDGREVHYSVTEYLTKDVPAFFEAHDNYADIQVIISGNERIDYFYRPEGVVTVEYNPEKDILRLDSENYSKLKIKAGEFAVFLPHDAHRPNLSDETQQNVKKIVIKVKV